MGKQSEALKFVKGDFGDPVAAAHDESHMGLFLADHSRCGLQGMQAAWGEAGQGEVGSLKPKEGRQKTEKVVVQRFQQIEGIHLGKTGLIQLPVVELPEIVVCPLFDRREQELISCFGMIT